VSEAVGESGLHLLDVSASAGAWGTSSLGLSAPVELAYLGRSLLLDVVVASAGGAAKRVRLVVTLSETGRTLRHVGLLVAFVFVNL